MLTKLQKKEHIGIGRELIEKSEHLIFVDFSGLSVNDTRKLKMALKSFGSTYKVMKKRLIKISFKEAGIEFDPKQFAGQLGIIFVPKDFYGVASGVYGVLRELLKAKKELKIVGAYDIAGKKFIDAAKFSEISKLPSREELLTRLVVYLTVPMKRLLLVLNCRKDKLQGITVTA